MVDIPRLDTSMARVGSVPGSGLQRLEPSVTSDVRQTPSVSPTAARAAQQAAGIDANTGEIMQGISQRAFSVNLERTRALQSIQAQKKLSEFELQIQRANREILQTAEPSDIQRKTLESYDKTAKQLLERKNLSGFERDILSQRLRETRDVVGQKAFGIQTEVENEEALMAANEKLSIDQRIVFDDPSTLELKIAEAAQAIEQLPIPAIEKEKIRSDYEEKMSIASILGKIKDDPDKALQALEAGRFDSRLTLSQREALKGDASDAIEVRNRAIEKENKAESDRLDANIGVRIEVGDIEDVPSQTQLDTYRSQGLLNDSQWEQHTIKRRKRLEKERESFEIAQQGAEIINSGIGVNPENKGQVAAINSYYEAALPNMNQMEPAARNASIARIVKQSKFVPEMLKGEFKKASRSSDKDTVIQAANLYERIAQESPHMLQHLGAEKDIARITMINERIRASSTPEQAFTAVDQILSNPNHAQAKQQLQEISRKTDYRERAVNLLSNIEGVGDFFKKVLPGPVLLEDDVITQSTIDEASLAYRLKFEDHYLITRDEVLSDQRAQEHTRGIFGRTIVNGGDKAVKYPPETKYSIEGIDNQWMREQFIKQAKELLSTEKMLISQEARENIENRIRIAPIPGVTDKTWEQGRPGYDIIFIRDDGTPISLLNFDQTGDVFFFDPEDARKKEIEKAKDKERKRRDREMSLGGDPINLGSIR